MRECMVRVCGGCMCGAFMVQVCVGRIRLVRVWCECVNAGMWCMSGWFICVVCLRGASMCSHAFVSTLKRVSERAFNREFVWWLLRVCIVRENA